MKQVQQRYEEAVPVDRLKPYPLNAKRCPRCKIKYPQAEGCFDRNRAQRDGWSPYCKPCKKATYSPSDASRTKARDAARVAMRERRAANPEWSKVISRTYYNRHREVAKERQRDYNARMSLVISERNRKRRETDPYRFRALDEAKHARRRSAPGRLTANDVRKQFNAQDGCCWWCDVELDDGWEVDHVVPLSRGGWNNPENVVAACVPCNQRKRAMLVEEWTGFPYVHEPVFV